MERKLIKNLQAYLAPLLAIPVILFDSNEDRDLPVVVVGIESVEVHPLLDANASVNGYVVIGYRGTQDPTNAAEGTVTAIKGHLQSADLYAAVNAPTEGADNRPGKPFKLEHLALTGTDRTEEEHSTIISIRWEAFVSNCD